MVHRIFVDSNVLYARTTRDWLFLLRNETHDLFQVHSSIDVIAEVVRAVRRRRPELAGSATRALHDLLIENLDEIVSDYDAGIPFAGKDPDDLHVHAAAVAAQSDILLTSNGRDFGDRDLLSYELWAPDEFFVLIDESASELVRRVVVRQRAYWRGLVVGDRGARDLAQALRVAGCPAFGERVQGHLASVGGSGRRG